ncbi:hypothetical protein GXM_06161 [Nostoc sphaeroides CCNUC1]|uniref:Uncharacterized protein n=1 Tax=Nostoc sphaeroides CCNUC1 TaxID=2653204 RepID=A0A5P8W7C4_9NOSO|nr:hypothetical protein GXM_06161 [Nostoc sphaeroides CCNUC1]
MFEKSSVSKVLDPPKSTPVAHGGNPQDRTGSPMNWGTLIPPIYQGLGGIKSA